jgi:hypothetical protein
MYPTNFREVSSTAGWRGLTVLSLIAVGLAGLLGHLGLALLLLAIAPLIATVAELRRRRRAPLGLLRPFPLTDRQRTAFTAWFLYVAYLAVGVCAGAIGGGIHSLLR